MPLSTYPKNLDTFSEYTETDSPSNVVSASIVNKLGEALNSIESRLLTSVNSIYSTGPIFYSTSTHVVVPQDTHSNLFSVRMEIDSSVSLSLFNSTPFNSSNGIMCSARGYVLSNNVKRYFRVDSAVAPVIGNNEKSVTVVCLRGDGEWYHGNVIEVQLLVIKNS